MRKSVAILTFLATTFSVVSQTFAAPDPNFHIYLAFGQSNMEGAGPIEGQDRNGDKRFQLLSAYGGCNGRTAGQWYDATPPLANCAGKLGPVDYFGRTLIKKLPQQIKVGVTVVAIAGCDIQLFEKNNYKSYQLQSYMQNTVNGYGGNPYGRLVEMGKKAKEVGVIKGILLHQGETNTGQQNWPNRVKAIYEDLLKDLGLNAKDVPLLAGEVVSSASGGSCGSMNSIIQKLPQVIPTAHVVSSQGLKHQGDGLHFTSADYRTFGQRYAEEMLKLLGDVSVADSGNTGGNTSDNSNSNTTTEPAPNPPAQDNNSNGQGGNGGNGGGFGGFGGGMPDFGNGGGFGGGQGGGMPNFGGNGGGFGGFGGGQGGGMPNFGGNGGGFGGFGGGQGGGMPNFGGNGGGFGGFGGGQGGGMPNFGGNGGGFGGFGGGQGGGMPNFGGNGGGFGGFGGFGGGNGGNGGNKGSDATEPSSNSSAGSDSGSDSSCWAKKLGYSCCSGKAYVLYTDKDGQWGVENDDWCGIPKVKKGCWAEALGYKCCSTGSCKTVAYFDYDGQWGYENGDWCGITADNTIC